MSSKELPARKEVLKELDFLTTMGGKIFLCPFTEKSRLQNFGYIITFILIVCTTTQLFLTFLTNSTDWLEIINVAPNLGVCVLTVIKYRKLETNRILYNDIFLHFRHDMWDVVTPCSRIQNRIVFKYSKVSRVINRFLLYYSIPLIFVVDSFPYLVMKYEEKVMNYHEYLYPFDGWYPFDKVKFYSITYVWESCMTAVVVFVYCFSNMLHASYIAFTCMELRILCNCLEGLISPYDVLNIKRGIDVNEIHLKVVRKLKIIIEKYVYLEKKCAALDVVLGDAMLFNYSLGAVFICLTAFTSTVIDNLYKRVRYSFMCVSLLVEIFNQCFIGQILSDHSKDLTDAVYSSDWPHASAETKKIMLMLMLRTQNHSSSQETATKV